MSERILKLIMDAERKRKEAQAKAESPAGRLKASDQELRLGELQRGYTAEAKPLEEKERLAKAREAEALRAEKERGRPLRLAEEEFGDRQIKQKKRLTSMKELGAKPKETEGLEKEAFATEDSLKMAANIRNTFQDGITFDEGVREFDNAKAAIAEAESEVEAAVAFQRQKFEGKGTLDSGVSLEYATKVAIEVTEKRINEIVVAKYGRTLEEMREIIERIEPNYQPEIGPPSR